MNKQIALDALEPFVDAFAAARESYVRRYANRDSGLLAFDKMPDGWPMDRITFAIGDFRRAASALAVLSVEDSGAVERLCGKVEADAVSALRYIENRYGRLEGVGWDRVFDAHDELFALAALRVYSSDGGGVQDD